MVRQVEGIQENRGFVFSNRRVHKLVQQEKNTGETQRNVTFTIQETCL